MKFFKKVSFLLPVITFFISYSIYSMQNPYLNQNHHEWQKNLGLSSNSSQPNAIVLTTKKESLLRVALTSGFWGLIKNKYNISDSKVAMLSLAASCLIPSSIVTNFVLGGFQGFIGENVGKFFQHYMGSSVSGLSDENSTWIQKNTGYKGIQKNTGYKALAGIQILLKSLVAKELSIKNSRSFLQKVGSLARSGGQMLLSSMVSGFIYKKLNVCS